MRSITFAGAAFVLAFGAVCAASMLDCSGGTSGVAPGEEGTGTVGVALTVPGGETIGAVTWAIRGPHAYAGTHDVGGAGASFAFVISDVAPGSGYTITLSATSADGAVACSGTSSAFSVAANQTTSVNVLLACATTLEAGSVLVNGAPFDCASWHTAVAFPSTAPPGGTVSLAAWASAPDPSAITYRWSAPSGTFGDATSPDTTFTCPTTPSQVPITLVVGDGPVPDGGACPAASSTTSLTVTCRAPDCKPTFAPLASFVTTAGNANRPAIADVNGDGVPDLALAVTGGVDVFVSQHGAASWARTSLVGGTNTGGALLGDMDGDGKIDVVQMNYGPHYTTIANGVMIYPGAGDGTFGPAIAVATGDANPISGALADFDGDGKLDVAVNHNNGGWTTAVLLNQGGGRFVASWSRYLGTNPHYVQAGDVNGDGRADLVVSTYFSGLKVALNVGGGAFGPTSSVGPSGATPGDVVIADLDGDGARDLAVVTGGAKVSVFLNDHVHPFASSVDYAIASPSEGLTVADFDGKNGPDVALGSAPTSLSLLANQGNGTFGAEQRFTGVRSPRFFAAGDFDRDGRPDLAVTFESDGVNSDSLALFRTACAP